MTCNDCPYYYQGLDDYSSYCHFNADDWLDNTAPCERDDDYEVDN